MRFKKSPIIGGAVLAMVIACEMVARYGLGLGDPPLSVAHSEIEYMYKPNQDVMRFGKRFIVNQYGMRSDTFEMDKAHGELRVMVFGDSVVNGGSLTDQSDLATTILATKMNASLGRRVTVGNISAGSWGPGNWLAYARNYGFFDADVVILVMSSHDVTDNPTFSPLNPNTHPTVKPLLALTEGLARYLPRYLPAFTGESSIPAEIVKFEVNGLADMQYQKERVRGLGDLKDFLLMAQAQTRNVLVLQWPTQQEIAVGVPNDGFPDITQLTRDLGLQTILVAPYLTKEINSGLNPYRDNIHPNEVGQGILAKVLTDLAPEKRTA